VQEVLLLRVNLEDLTTDLDQPMWCVYEGVGWISRNIRKWEVMMFPLHVLLEMIWPRKCAQTDDTLISTRIMVEVVILHVIHNFTANFTLP
jgi:hypothetical protein